MSVEEIAKAFVQHYYTTLDTNPQALSGLYQAQSVLTFESTRLEGPQAIIAKFASLGQLSHNIPQLTIDVQLSLNPSAMLIFVTGFLKIGGQDNPLHFAQVFQLVATAPGQYFVNNEIFRLIYS